MIRLVIGPVFSDRNKTRRHGYRRPKTMSKKNTEQRPGLSLKYVFSIAFMVAILVVTYMLLPKNYSWAQIKDIIFSANPWYILLGLVMMLIYQACIAQSIRILVDAFTGIRYPFELSFKTAFVGFYFNNITPSATGGQPMEMYYLKKRGVDLSHTSMIFILLAIFYNIAIVGSAAIALLVKPGLISRSLGFMRGFVYFGFIITTAMAVLLFLLVVKPRIIRSLLKFVSAILFKLRLVRRPSLYLRRVVSFSSGYKNNSIQLLKKPGLLIQLFVLHILQILALFLVPFLVSLAMGGSFSMCGDFLSLQAMLYVATSAIPTPGAVGITETGFITMFASVLPDQQIMPAMLLTRMVNLYGFLIVSAIITVISFTRVDKDNKRALLNEDLSGGTR